MPRFATCSAAAFILLVVGTARADEVAAPPAPPPRRVVLEGQIGPYAPLGQMGAAVTVDAWRWLSITAGAGSVEHNEFGELPRLLLMPRGRFWSSPTGAVTASGGLGLAYGEQLREGYTGVRLDGEAALEFHGTGGLELRAFAGVGRLLTSAGEPGGTLLPTYRPYGGVAVGYAVWPNPPVDARAAAARPWYGWQTLIATVLAPVMYVFPTAEPGVTKYNQNHLAASETATVYLLSGPLVHYAHHRYDRAALSMALRIGLPALGYWWGGDQHYVMSDSYGSTLATAGLVTGAVIATLIDVIWLSRESPEPL